MISVNYEIVTENGYITITNQSLRNIKVRKKDDKNIYDGHVHDDNYESVVIRLLVTTAAHKS